MRAAVLCTLAALLAGFAAGAAAFREMHTAVDLRAPVHYTAATSTTDDLRPLLDATRAAQAACEAKP